VVLSSRAARNAGLILPDSIEHKWRLEATMSLNCINDPSAPPARPPTDSKKKRSRLPLRFSYCLLENGLCVISIYWKHYLVSSGSGGIGTR